MWRQYPTEIEAELADRGYDILDWHRGRMSSRRLLVLLKHARETGPYMQALRDGGWPPVTKILAEVHKELALYRASKYAGGDNEYAPLIFVDPVTVKREAEEAAAADEFREKVQTRVFGKLGWTREGGD